MTTTRIALAQVNPTVGDLAGNLELMSRDLGRARDAGAKIVVFPEMVLAGYPPEDLVFKPDFLSESARLLEKFARSVAGCLVVAGFAERNAGLTHNSCAIIADGAVRAVYRKEILPNYGVFDEKRHFSPGSRNPVFQSGRLRFGVSICEDIWVADGPAAAQAASGCRLLINASASPYEAGKDGTKEKMLAERARAAGAWLAYVNLVGGQDEIVFNGRSVVFDPDGHLFARARAFEEDLLVCDIEVPGPPPGRGRRHPAPVRLPPPGPVSGSRAKRRVEEPAGETAEIYRALVTGTGDYLRKNGFREAVVGLSGGLDSALVAVIAADCLGPERVHAIYMPGPASSAISARDSRRLAEGAGLDYRVVPIVPVYRSFLEALGPELGDTGGTTVENIQARVRGNILMAFSNRFGWLVLATGNKSEFAAGYCTLYGDMSGGLAVLKDVPKTLAYRLAAYRNSLGEVIPARTIRRAPSAELSPGQKDTDSLPPYDLFDPVMRDYVEGDLSLRAMISRGHHPELARRVTGLVDASEYKRRQAPPGIKISGRAFGRDWRQPLTNRFRPAGLPGPQGGKK